MVLPLIAPFSLGALVATATLRIPPLGAEHPEHAQSIFLEVVGSATPDWTLAIQGRVHPDGVFTNVTYSQIWDITAAALANATLTVNDTTRRFYILPIVAPFMQVVCTRTTGTLTILGSYSSQSFSQWLLTTARGGIFAEGPAAQDAEITGNPLSLGVLANAAAPTDTSSTNSKIARLWGTRKGAAHVSLVDNAGNITGDLARDSTDNQGQVATDDTSRILSRNSLMNGATQWDRERNNHELTVFSSAARTSTANSADITNYNGRSVKFVLDVGTVTGTSPTLDVKIQGKDTLSGTYQDITGAAFTQKTSSTSTDDLTIALGITIVANRSISNVVPRIFRAVATIAGTSPSFTFSLSANVIN